MIDMLPAWDRTPSKVYGRELMYGTRLMMCFPGLTHEGYLGIYSSGLPGTGHMRVTWEWTREGYLGLDS